MLTSENSVEYILEVFRIRDENKPFQEITKHIFFLKLNIFSTAGGNKKSTLCNTIFFNIDLKHFHLPYISQMTNWGV